MEEKVKGSYTADNIQVLEGLDPVRKRPACISDRRTNAVCIT